MKTKTTVLASLLALSTLSGAAIAGEAGQGFLQGQAGRSDVTLSVDGFGSESDKDNALTIRGGYYFHQNFAVEAFASNVYDEDFGIASLKASAIGIGLVGKRNFGADGNGFFIDGRVGVSRGTLKGCLDGYGCGSEHSNKPYFGVGAGYDFNKSFGLGLNFDRLKGDGDGVSVEADVLSLGAEVRW